MEPGLTGTEKPIGDFVLKHGKGVEGEDGTYYHYSEVCTMLGKCINGLMDGTMAEYIKVPRPDPTSIYFKCKVTYYNGQQAKGYCYYKFSSDGSVVTASTTRRTVSRPKTLNIPAGFELSNAEEFERIKNEILSGL